MSTKAEKRMETVIKNINHSLSLIDNDSEEGGDYLLAHHLTAAKDEAEATLAALVYERSLNLI